MNIETLKNAVWAIGLATALSTPLAASTAAENERENADASVAKAGKVRAGVLSCEVEGGIGLIVGSSKKLQCNFKQGKADQAFEETYQGTINKFGLDVGITGKQFMKWVVFAPDAVDVKQGFGGKYVGISADGSLGVGFGANALVGGSDKNFVLQPLSLQTGTGVNVAIGVSSMKLEKALETPKS